MKIIGVLLAASAVIAANAEATNKVRKVRSDAERRARFERRILEREGGWVNDMRNQEGWIAVLNAQKKVGKEHVDLGAKRIERELKVPIKVIDSDQSISLGNAQDVFSKVKANLAVFVVENDELPGLVVVPEKRYAFVNVREYAGGFQAQRVRHEVSRAICFICGSGIVADRTVVNGPVTKQEQLGYICDDMFSMETTMNMINVLRYFNVTPYKRLTYREACQEGWASPPTNEFQKAVWDKVHQLPTKPIKIEFDPKKGE